MFDTVKIGVPRVALEPAQLLHRGWEQKITRQDDAEGVPHERIHFVKGISNGAPSYIAYFPSSASLVTQVSLPRLLYGENIAMLAPGDIPRVLDELSSRLRELTGSSPPPSSTWEIKRRVDAVFSWEVGDFAKHYLSALGQKTLARHRLETVNGARTVYWKNSSRVIRAYDKFEAAKVDHAKGLLRFEVQMNRPKDEIKRLTGIASAKVDDVLNWQVAKAVLGHYLEALGADLFVSDRIRYSATKSIRLFGFLALMRVFSREEVISMGFSRNSLWRNTRDLERAGVSTLTSVGHVLPPLLLPTDYDGSPGQVLTPGRCL